MQQGSRDRGACWSVGALVAATLLFVCTAAAAQPHDSSASNGDAFVQDSRSHLHVSERIYLRKRERWAQQRLQRDFTAYPLELALVPPISLWRREHKIIVGVAVNAIYGRAASTYGIVAGLINHHEDRMVGVQIGAANYVRHDAYGIQLAALFNIGNGACAPICASGIINVHGSSSGLQLSGGFNWADHGGFLLQISSFGNGTSAGVVGLQLSGLFNYVRYSFVGLQIGLFNWNSIFMASGRRFVRSSARAARRSGHGRSYGMQIGGYNGAHRYGGVQIGAFANQTNQRMTGIQLSALVNYASEGSGMQVGPFNFAASFSGAQLGALNSTGELGGIAIGVLNRAREVRGVQIGAVNIAGRLRGLQIGLLNIAYKNALPFMIGLNAGW